MESQAQAQQVEPIRPGDIVDCMLALKLYWQNHPDTVARGEVLNQPLSSRDWAHRDGHCYSEINGAKPVFAFLSYDDIRSLEGKLLTIADAAFNDQQQRKAFKDLVRHAIWFDWAKHLDTDDPRIGLPSLKPR